MLQKLTASRKLPFSLILLTAFITSACSSTPFSLSGPEKKPLTSLERARLLVEVANGSLLEGDPTGALQSLARAEEFEPSLPELHHSRALAFYAKHNLKEAVASARKAVNLMPSYSAANNTLGKLLMDLGNDVEAEAPLLVAANDPLYREAFKSQTNLGILYYRRGNYAKSEEHLSRAIQEIPAVSCVAYYYRGHIYLKNGKFQEAIREYEKATQKFCASFADAHLALGIAYERTKQYDLARKKFIDIRRNFPDTQVGEQAVSRLKYLP